MRSIAVTVALATLVSFAAAADHGAAPGDPDLLNLEHVSNHNPTPNGSAANGTDLEFYTVDGRDYVVVGFIDLGAIIYDITDPEDVTEVARVDCPQHQNDVQIKRFGDRWILALANDDTGRLNCAVRLLGGRSGGVSLFDITDPAAPEEMYSIGVLNGAHNFTFHPTEPYGWVSSGEIPGARDYLYTVNLTDLAVPRMGPSVISVGGVHDVAFSADGSRAYVASSTNARIYDTSDPAAPAVVGGTTFPSTYVHDAVPTPDGALMLVVNESLALGGFFAPGICPGEGLTIFDLTQETAPVPVGYFAPDLAGPAPDARACTAHVGRTSANARFHALGWYIGGVRVVDLSDPSAPVEAGRAVMPNAEVWSAKMYRGPYVYAGDQIRGLDVFRWTGPSFVD